MPSHYLNQWWPRSAAYGNIIRGERVNKNDHSPCNHKQLAAAIPAQLTTRVWASLIPSITSPSHPLLCYYDANTAVCTFQGFTSKNIFYWTQSQTPARAALFYANMGPVNSKINWFWPLGDVYWPQGQHNFQASEEYVKKYWIFWSFINTVSLIFSCSLLKLLEIVVKECREYADNSLQVKWFFMKCLKSWSHALIPLTYFPRPQLIHQKYSYIQTQEYTNF